MTILSEGLKYHMDNNKPLTEHLYRAGSDNYFNLWAEARSLYSRDILEITHEDDLAVLTETDLGHFGMFEGKKVPLDFPIELNEQMDIYDEIANMEFGMDYDQLGSNEQEWVRDEIDNMNEELTIAGKKVKTIHKNDSNNVKDHEIEYEDGTKEPYLKHIIKEAAKKYKKGDKLKVKLKNGKEFDITFDSYSSNKGIAYGKIDGDRKPFSLDAVVSEAKAKKKKGPKLNKPMRDSSGGKAYKVYVKDPKTKKVKTVRFGSGGLRAKINDKKARNAFAKRHKCSTKKDKTKAGYWSCRLPRYAKLLGLKSNFGGFW